MANEIVDTTTVLGLQSFLRQILASQLGQFANGRKAIAVEPPTVPSAGTGLHVFVGRYSHRISKETHQWKVTFTQFDKTEQGLQSLDEAIAIMQNAFPCRQEMSPPYQADMYPQKIFLLSSFQSFYLSAIPTGAYDI